MWETWDFKAAYEIGVAVDEIGLTNVMKHATYCM